MRTLALAMALLVLGAATPDHPDTERGTSAKSIYRCDAPGEIVFQDAPCRAGDAPITLRDEASFGDGADSADSRPGHDAPGAARAATHDPRRGGEARRATAGGPASASSARRARPAVGPGRSGACERARAARDAAYARGDDTLTYDARSRLQAAMDDACGMR